MERFKEINGIKFILIELNGSEIGLCLGEKHVQKYNNEVNFIVD